MGASWSGPWPLPPGCPASPNAPAERVRPSPFRQAANDTSFPPNSQTRPHWAGSEGQNHRRRTGLLRRGHELFYVAPRIVQTEAVDERKVATVLFADLVGSTELGASQDPERTRAMLERFYAAMAAEVGAAGGTVEKYAGDAVM